jgi:hypothetical protein
VTAWHLLEAGPRQVFRDDLRCGNLAMSQMGRRTLKRIPAATPA